MSKPIENRITVFPKDVIRITGLKLRSAQKLLAAIRKKYDKDRGAFISITDFCRHTGLNEDEVRPFLR